MHNSGTMAQARLRMVAIALGALALASCTDALSPRNHGREGTVVQLSPDTRAELVSPGAGTLELRFVAGPGRERVQSFQGEIRFKASRYRVLSATAGEGAAASWHGVEPGRIRFAGVATEGIAGRGIVFRFEEGESFRADDFQLVMEEAVLRSALDAAPVRFTAPAEAGAAAVSGPRRSAQGGTPAAQAAWEMRGDVNGDGGMDAVDALAVLSHVVGKALPATFAVQPQGDVSRDGAVTAADALLMLEYRVGRDRVVDVQITTSAGPVDVADSLVLTAELRGVRGEPLNGTVAWSCPDSTWVRECGPRLFRPAYRAAPSPVPVRLVASSGGRADTLETRVFERDLSLLQVNLTPYPASVSSNNAVSQQMHAIRAMPGGTNTVFASAWDAEGRLRPREFRVSVEDTTLFTAAVGRPGPERTPVMVTGRRAGSGVLTILTNGVSVPVRVEVAAPAALACSPANALSLDLAPGEIRTFRGSDPGAPGCLDFRAERDRGRQYLVLTFLLPYSTGRPPNGALEGFDFEGQALFYGAGEARPAEYPVFRIYTPDLRAASLAVASRGQAAQRAEPGHTWRVGGATLREGRPSRERAVHEFRPGARRGGQGARLNVSGATASIQAGDTLVSGAFSRLDRGVRTTDGGPASDRAVVTHAGENLIIAEHLDVLRGRLIGGDGRAAARIPEAEYAKIDAAYGRPKRQLDRLFGGPYAGTVAGRDGGGRELAVNMPLQTGVWGYAYGDLTTINYWSGSFDGQPSLSQTPLLMGELLFAHEFTHVRHFQQWSDRDTQVGPWVVEGFADFGSQLAYAARVLGSETPSRTGRAALGPAGLRGQVPSMMVASGSLFGGYENSSFVFAYIADQVEARGGDGLRAARDLALSAHSRVAAEQAIQRHLPGHSLTEVIARAEVARYLEFLRKQSCGWCNSGDPVPPALRIAPDLPAHTRYLQYDHPAMGNVMALFTAAWPIVRPGRSAGTAYQLRTGTSWPLFIDGTDPLGDAQYLVDLSGERQTVVSVVRIR
jgi:hypothetical protein